MPGKDLVESISIHRFRAKSLHESFVHIFFWKRIACQGFSLTVVGILCTQDMDFSASGVRERKVEDSLSLDGELAGSIKGPRSRLVYKGSGAGSEVFGRLIFLLS